ncbi:hypothetical protein [Paenibacillus polymyxa]|uniref:hypothetical protein n=1 Tax=Paenibacillus polymyxa TaxID=1406 RepID=UPI002AB4B5DA|nr:hypothetical protein [Paenibacillus polymyxa]MDY8023735.1 hypothetical protein [Paenibacillus polymyxa]
MKKNKKAVVAIDLDTAVPTAIKKVGGLIDQSEEFTTEAKKSAAMLGEELACLLDEYRHLHFALFTMKTYTYC